MLTGQQIRRTFLDFFAANGHRVVRSSSLVPMGDATLLFTNAGMNQFKDVFLGIEQRDYRRATTAQKCVRAGGKHNDLENVGFTNRHHTFFEMLGNFSFGDYFKKDAVAFAWELITSSAAGRFGLPVDKLYFTVFGGAEVAPGVTLGTDEEALELWVNVGAPRQRVIAIPGLKENFWAMGETGPCGPCSEIFYDMGPAASDQGHTDCAFGCECGRYVEIWNLVFMQFNRDAAGTVAPLPKPSIDTGMGLERLTAVLQGKVSNFDTDIFMPLITRAAELTDTRYGADIRSDVSLRIVADHARATVFLIADGVQPSNEGRGYVLRKIMRRAMRHARLLGENVTGDLLTNMVNPVRELMSEAYPELVGPSGSHIIGTVAAEERRFRHTIDVGLRNLEKLLGEKRRAYEDQVLRTLATDPETQEAIHSALATIKDGQELKVNFDELLGPEKAAALREKHGKPILLGEEAFKLYDTYGLPLDFILDAVRDSDFRFDQPGFDRAMEEQRTRARASWKGAHKEAAKPVYAQIAAAYRTEPDFYFGTTARDCRIVSVVKAGTAGSVLSGGEEGEIILDRTTIYAESGGQQADTGAFYDSSGSAQVAEVLGAYYPIAGLIAHRVIAKEDLHIGDRVVVKADAARRERNKCNHTATHLMHAALRNILGTHVKQAGSLVAPDRLRFDFTHFAGVDAAELTDIEQQVNEQIRQNAEIVTDVTTIDDALASGALAFFGDRYPESNVRVVTIPDAAAPRGFYSKELCGGTHVRRSGDIGVFKIAVEQSVAAGVRRIEAITGEGALADYQRARQLLSEVGARLHAGEDEIGAAIERLTQAQKQAEKQLETVRRKAALAKLDSLLTQVRAVKDVRVLATEIEGVDREGLRQLVDPLRQKMGPGVFVLGAVENGSVALISSVTKDLSSRLHAGKIIQAVAGEIGGKGGGRPDLAEAAGKDTSNLKSALSGVYALVERML